MSEGTHPNVFPTLRYKDASAALEWLDRGEDGAIQHAELRLGTGMIMFGQHRQGWMGQQAARLVRFPPEHLRCR